METSQLTSEEFWHGAQSYAFANPRDTVQVEAALLLDEWLAENLPAHLCFATSGSTGEVKWVAVSKSAMLASAEAVNAHLSVTESDRWLLTLPTFHVGGMGIVARAFLSGSQVTVASGSWSAEKFLHNVDGCSLTSMVPTQLSDVVAVGEAPPRSLRGVLIGGGRLDDALYEEAVSLGWPVMETYGMTEACSQVATAQVGGRVLEPLPCWELDLIDDRLALQGSPLFSGYITRLHNNWELNTATDDGWFLTNDRVQIEGGTLEVLGRVDRCVKILGELVNLDAVCHGEGRAVIALPDARKGSRLVACYESNEVIDIKKHNAECPPLHRLDGGYELEIPRSPLGKIRYQRLAEMVLEIEAGLSG